MLLRLAKPVLILPVRNLTKKPKSIITNLNYFKSGKSDGPPFTHFVQIGKFRIKFFFFFRDIKKYVNGRFMIHQLPFK